MNNQLIENIDNYISYLNSIGLSVSVHGKMVSGLLEHNIHKNPFCAFVKTNDEAWEKCVKCQKKVFDRSGTKLLFGMCYAGVEEYVFYVDDQTFISVSGYGINKKKAKERIDRLSEEFFFNKEELINIYENGLKHQPENITDLKTLIYPLCHMLQLLQFTLGEITEFQSKNKTFDSILAYVQRNLMQDITLSDIANACLCSESTVSHLFKEHTKQSPKKYILNLRIKQAQKLLIASDIPITNIALLCGFSDSNYFSAVFKRSTGISPTEYRKDPHITGK